MNALQSLRVIRVLQELALVGLLASCLVGCGLTSSARVQVADVRAKPPAEVEIVVAVHDIDGPVTYLEESSFFISENDVELDPAEHPLAFGDPAEISTEVLILVDTTEKDPQVQKGLERGLSHLLEKLGKARRVRILGFDGGPDPSFEREYTPGSSSPELAPIGDEPADNARNLNGALSFGFDELSRAEKDESPFFGVLVVVSLGPDTAGRVPGQDLWKKLDSKYFPVYSAVLAGPSIERFGEVERLEFTVEDLPLRLTDLGMLLRAQLESLYLLRYCSSARSGSRSVSVRVRYEGADGNPRGAKGAARKTIDTSGFRAGCKVEEATSESNEAMLTEGVPEEAALETAASDSAPEAPPAKEDTEKKSAKGRPKPKVSTPPTKSAEPRAPVVAPPPSEDYR